MRISLRLAAGGLLAVFCLATAPAVFSRSPARVDISFAWTTNTGMGKSLFVVGNHPDLGNWNPTAAVKLVWTSGNIWTGRVAVQAGTALEFKYIVRNESSGQYCNPANVEWMPGANLSNTVVAQPAAPYTGKTLYYHSGWTSAALIYLSGTNWMGATMSRLGPGRGPGEYLYQASGFGEAGESIEFVPNGWYNGTQYWDNAPYPSPLTGDNNYNTPLDFIFLQDGQIYNYWPPATVSASRISSTNVSSSWAPTIPSRDIRVYVPRGYDQNTWKRYPVLYMHDGQNVFDPGEAYGAWGTEHTADREISQGRMRECIIVGVNNTSARLREYVPPGDNGGFGAGTGDQYANFLIHNVRPTIDYHYRTLNDPANTLTLGSSFGGMISAYLGLGTNVFGKIGPMSPSFWACSNFVGRIESNNTKGLRIYMDCGTDESDEDMWVPFWGVYGLFLLDGYAPNNDLLARVGCGQIHNEGAWSNRLPWAFWFLLSPWDEANLLAGGGAPPVISNTTLTASGMVFAVRTLGGWTYRVESRTNLVGSGWVPATNRFRETLPWSVRTFGETNTAGLRRFFRIVATNAW